MPKRPPDPLNPYQYLCRHELANLAWGIIAELQEQRLRTREERTDLTQRVQWLLRAYCWLSHSLDIVDDGLKRGRFLADNYMEHYASEERRLRHSVMRQAEEAVLTSAERPRWSMTMRTNGQTLAQLVHDSPDGLRIALGVLERIWRERSATVAGGVTLPPAEVAPK